MDAAYYHLLINELPLIGVIIGIAVLLGGLLLHNISVKRTALVIFMLSGLLTIPSYLTGKKAMEIVRQFPDIQDTYISSHMEAGIEFMKMIAVLSVLSLVTFFIDLKGPRKTSKIFYIVTVAAGIFMFFMTQNVGSSGREISHPEVRVEQNQTSK